MRRTKNEVAEVMTVMQSNLVKVLEREENLNSLEDKSERLTDSARHFQTSARTLTRKMWWQSIKGRVYIGIALTALAIVIFLVAKYHGKSG